MATRKFIKMYGIHDRDIDDKGNVNPDAALYPYYDNYTEPKTGMLYHDLLPDQIEDKLSDTDKVYDDNTNSYPDRVVSLFDSDDNFITKVGPGPKRGFSALAYSNPEKRHGDDYFDDWYPDDDADDYDAHVAKHITPDEFARRAQDPAFNYGDYMTAASDAKRLSEVLTPEKNDSIYKVPLIIEADDSDVINYNDVVRGNYDPTRDYIPEVQLKRVIRKSLIPNTFTIQTLADAQQSMPSELTALANKVMQYIEAAPKKFIADIDNKDLHEVRRMAAGAMSALTDVVLEFINGLRKVATFVPGFFNDSIMSQLVYVTRTGRTLGDDVFDCKDAISCAQIVVRFFEFAKNACGSELQKLINMATSSLKAASTGGTQILKKFNNVLKDATRKGGAFDWYDSSTYSDERLKDVYGGCHDIVLSDKQLKYIYDDFSKFKKCSTQNNITKGLRGLGQ